MSLKPSKIVCVGKNYLDHAKEMGSELPPDPLLFFKPPSALIAAGQPIVLPRSSSHVEHEAEIAVVIGSRLRHADEAAAMRGVAGFVCLNDVTARDWQKRESQWGRAKGFDTFCPLGDRAVPVADWRGLEVIGRVNGVVRQHGRAADMHFGIPFLVSHISQFFTLEPGDVIATGTPAGVGRLNPGDVVEVEIPGVGILRNPVVAE
ncbi:MAG: fumarylacetoacetate hydrolase family protein [Gemmatimonadales bacterium]|nr:fumarylacetoacetate hydrolase family protein [Gemmatimonadales bacterium]